MSDFRDRGHMLNCLLDELLKTRQSGETASQFAARLNPRELEPIYWERKVQEYARTTEETDTDKSSEKRHSSVWNPNQPDCRCGHPAAHHDAGECWTTADGKETWGDSACRCDWYEPATRTTGEADHG